MLAALLAVCPRLPLGVPFRWLFLLPKGVFQFCKTLICNLCMNIILKIGHCSITKSTVCRFLRRLPSAILEVAKKMVKQPSGKSLSAGAEKEAGWMLIGALVSTIPKQVCRRFLICGTGHIRLKVIKHLFRGIIRDPFEIEDVTTEYWSPII